MNKQAENDNEVITKAYIVKFHQENERSRRDVGLDFYDESNDLVENNQDNDFNDNKLNIIDSITINRNPTSDNEVTNKKYIDDELDKNFILRFNETLENCLKVSVGNDTYNPTKYNKIQITDTTIIKYPNTGKDLLQRWNIICNDKNNLSQIGNFVKSTKTSSLTDHSGATINPPIGEAFMYIETSGNNHTVIAYVILERLDIILITNFSFYYNRFSISTNDSAKSMGRSRNQLSLNDNAWSTKNHINKNNNSSSSSTEWSLLNLDITEQNYGVRLVYNKIDTAHADMCFSNISITHSVF